MFRLGWGLFLLAVVAAGQPAIAGRPIVIEEFTATWCGYCYAAGMALDRVQVKFPRSEVIVIAYHVDDDYMNSGCELRKSYCEPPGYPTCYFNGLNGVFKGHPISKGESGINTMYFIYTQEHIYPEKSRMGDYAPFNMTLSGDVGPTNPKMTLTIRSHEGYPREVRVHFVITEDNIAVTAPNGLTVLNDVARAVFGSQTITVPAGGVCVIKETYSGTIPYANAANLKPVAFIQDDSTREIVGAVGEFNYSAASHWAFYK